MIPSLLKLPKKRAIYLWNIIGNLANAAFSVLLSIVIARVCTPVSSDNYAIAFALGTQIYTVAYYEIGTLMVTDAKNTYSMDTYHSVKLLVSILSVVVLAAIVGYHLINGTYDPEKSLIVILYSAYKIIDSYSVYYCSLFQKYERLDIGGYSMTARILLCFAVFLTTLLLSGSLIPALSLMALVALVWTAAYDIRVSGHYVKPRISPDFSVLKSLLISCFPLFLSVFLQTYIINMPKYALDGSRAADGIQTAYSAISQPAAVINLLCIFIFRPEMTQLSCDFQSRRFDLFLNRVGKICILLTGLSVALLAGGYLLGIPVLRIVYGQIIRDDYLSAWMLVLFGGVCFAFYSLLYNLIVIIRKQKWLIAGYGVAMVLCLMIVPALVAGYGIDGAAWAYAISMAILVVLFLAIFVSCYLREKKGS